MGYDRFGNLIDDEGHDILDDDFEGEEWELDDEEPEFECCAECAYGYVDDFDISLEYDEDFDVSDPFDAEYDF